jgi:DNA-binding transcriptional LysR family regulator
VRIGSAWTFGSKGDAMMEVAPRLNVNSIDGAITAAELGLGLANVLSYQSAEAIAKGRLVRVLAEHAPPPMPISLLYDAGRAAMPAVRVFLDAMRDRAREFEWE